MATGTRTSTSRFSLTRLGIWPFIDTGRGMWVARALQASSPATCSAATVNRSRARRGVSGIGDNRMLFVVAATLALGFAVLNASCGARASPIHGSASSPISPPSRPANAPPIVGTTLNGDQLTQRNGSYVRILLSRFGSVTPEYEMDMNDIEPAPGQFTFGRADRIVNFAKSHGLAVRGHALVWDELIPAWVRHRHWTHVQLAGMLQRYIMTVVGRYRGRIQDWDVVNEPLTNRGGLRPSLWERVIGPGYIALALRAAHRADPSVRLFINDYGLGWPDSKERAMLRLVRRLRADHVPIDGVGVEAHYDINDHPTTPELLTSLRNLARPGVQVEITELDVTTRAAGSLSERLTRQAHVYAVVGGACRAVAACTAVTIWGITDADSWRGADQRALPFDSRYHAKPAWRALLRSLGDDPSQHGGLGPSSLRPRDGRARRASQDSRSTA